MPSTSYSFACEGACALAVFAQEASSGSALAARRFGTGPRGVLSLRARAPPR